jgi:signal transduction histidine kinase
VENAARLADANHALVGQAEGDNIRWLAAYGCSVPEGLRRITRELPSGRAMLDLQSTQMEDVSRSTGDAALGRVARELGVRSIFATPLVREGRAIGVLLVRRTEVRPFSEKQVELLKTFADQAAIAIANVRLFNETNEALERQTATSEVLRVISTSPTDVQPVFDSIAERAARLCSATMGVVSKFDGQLVHLVAFYGASVPAGDALRKIYPLKPGDETVTARAIRDRAPAQIPDVLADPRYVQKEASQQAGFRSIVAVPMVRDGQVVGAIAVTRAEPGVFPEKQVDLLKTFADQAVIAIENVRLFNETKEALDQQKASAEVLGAISGSIADTKPVFEKILASCERLFEGELVGITLADGDTVRLAAYHGPEGERLSQVYPLPLTRESGTGWAILNAKIAHFPDIEARGVPPGVVAGCRTLRVRAIVFAPMLFQGKGIGAIWVARAQPGAFTDKQIAQLRTFADQAVIAIQNARLVNETREALERQTATAEVLKVISSSPTDVAPVFDAILRSAVSLCGAELAAVFPFDGTLLHLGATHNWPRAALDYFSNVYPCPPSPKLLSGRTILSRSIVQIADASADEHYDPDSVTTGHWRRMLGAPMLLEGEPLGAFVVAWREPGQTPPRQVELLQTFADQAAIAIANVRLFNETKDALDQQKASAEILGAISNSIADTRPVFNKILESCQRLFAGTLVGINVLDDDGLVRMGAYQGPGREAFEKVFPLPVDRASGTGVAILDRAIVHIPDIEAEGVPRATKQGCRATGVKAVVFAPMLWETRAIGAIFVSRPQTGPFSEKEISLLRTFADQAVIAIQNVRLFREIQEKSAQLEVANKHKSEFLANMSHELRTPLNAIIGFSEVLIERMFGEVNEKQAEYLKDIHESGRHLLSLINDILDLSKIEAGRMELELSSFDLPSAVSNAMTLVRERAQRHGIQLGLDMDPRLGEFEADERKVKQILLNLLSNAVKFTPDGGRVDVSAKLDTDKVEIAVKDTGIGIAPEDHAAVFEEFKQVGRDYTRKAEGTGLGLALTRRLVELHGGEIALESALGKGSTFTVRLPLR